MNRPCPYCGEILEVEDDQTFVGYKKVNGKWEWQEMKDSNAYYCINDCYAAAHGIAFVRIPDEMDIERDFVLEPEEDTTCSGNYDDQDGN